MTTLVVAAHPDDEVLGCGGTIARLSRGGEDVFIAILGEGITSRFEGRDQADANFLVTELHTRARQVGAMLGAKEVFLYSLPDNRFDMVPLLDVVKIVEGLIDRLKPQVIFTHHGGDLNIDHCIVHRAVLTATRPYGGQVVEEIYAFEVPSSTEWAFHQFQPHFHPNVFYDITKTLDTKIDAMQIFESEFRPFPHPRSPESLRALARFRGSAVGFESAEAFELIRDVRKR